MATPVPYTGVPDQVPGLRPTPSIGVSTPPAAFGENIAQATQHMGQVVEGSGQELFDRAYAMQELQQHAEATSAMADAQNKGMNLLVNYNNTEGKNAVDGLPAFQQGLDKIREDGGKNLSPYASVLYNDSVRSSLFRLGFSGATHAKDEQKRYVVGAAQGAMAADMKLMELDPDNPGANAAALDRIPASADHISDIHGLAADDPQRLMARNDAVNKAVVGQIRGLSEKGDFIGATKLFNQAVANKEIYGEDSARMGEYIKWNRDIHGSRVTAGQVLKGFNGSGPVLSALFQNESGGRNIANTTEGTTSGQAQGFFQITTGTWKEFAGQAGIDLTQYPTPMSAPYKIQAQMANIIPLRRWDSTTIAVMRKAGGRLDINKTLGENLAANGESIGLDSTNLSDIVARGRAAANDQFPGDEDFADATEARIEALYRQEKAIRADTDFNNDQTISSALFGGVGPQKKIPTTLEELQMDPKAKQAWDDMQMQHPSEMRKYLSVLATNAKGDVAMTPERLNQWQTLSGEAVQDPQKFMSDTQDLGSLDLPRAQKLEIIRMQGQIYKKEDVNPQMGHALGIAGPMLDSLGITKDNDADKRNLFVGVLHDAMEQYTRQNGKPMSDDDIKTTTQRLLNPVTSGGWGMFQHNTPWFESIDQVPPEISESIRQEYESRGIQPDDKAIMGAYLAAQYQELYGKKATAPSGGGYTPQRSPQTAPNIKTFQ